MVAAKKKNDLFSDLMSRAATPQPQDKKKAKATKPNLSLSAEEAQVIDRLCAADAIMKVAKAHQEDAKAKAHEILRPQYFSLCAEGQVLPENPIVQTEHSKANFQVKHVSRFALPSTPDGNPVSIADLLEDCGFDQPVIDEISAHVVKENATLGLKSFSSLKEGTPEQQNLADKLMELIKKKFTDAELLLLLDKQVQVSVDDSWKERAVRLACQGVADIEKRKERLAKLFAVIPVQFAISHMVTNVQLEQALKDLNRQTTEENEKPKTKKEIVSPNCQYKAVVAGSKVVLYLMVGNNAQLLGEKQCDNPGHAENSVKKWFRDPDSLAAAIEKFKK